MERTVTLTEAPLALRLERKRKNLDANEQRKRERTCFWTWPLGHVYKYYLTEPVKRRTVGGERVLMRTFTKVCQCCNYEQQTKILRPDDA